MAHRARKSHPTALPAKPAVALSKVGASPLLRERLPGLNHLHSNTKQGLVDMAWRRHGCRGARVGSYLGRFGFGLGLGLMRDGSRMLSASIVQVPQAEGRRAQRQLLVALPTRYFAAHSPHLSKTTRQVARRMTHPHLAPAGPHHLPLKGAHCIALQADRFGSQAQDVLHKALFRVHMAANGTR